MHEFTTHGGLWNCLQKAAVLINKIKFVNLLIQMVNVNLSTKSKILKILRAEEKPVKGELLAAECGISRVAVWKAVQALEQAGYGIGSSRSGYELTKDLEDSLYPWEFEKDEANHYHFAKTESTMIQAKNAVEDCADGEMKIITADMQSNGKGHAEHKWTTTKGSLAFTVASREHIPLMESHRFVMAAQIAIAKTLEKNCGKKIYLRWPNDIWTENGKAGGILDDLCATGSITNWVNLGIGINLLTKPRIEKTDCIFKAEKKILRRDLLSEIIANLKTEMKLAKENDSGLEKLWNLFCPDTGREFFLKDSGKKLIFKGINSYGWAITESNGEEKLFPPCTINLLKNGVLQ